MKPIENEVAYPAGSDQELLKKLWSRVLEECKKRFAEDVKVFRREAEMKEQALTPLVDRLGLKREDVEEEFAEKHKAMYDLCLQLKPPSFKPIRGQNPTRYAPFDMSIENTDCSSRAHCELYGPDEEDGVIGANLGALYSGSASSITGVGFWHYAQQGGTLNIIAQALIGGNSLVYSTVFGYAESYTGLRIVVFRFNTSNIFDWSMWSATTDLYRNWGIIEYDLRTIHWDMRNVSISVPTRPNTWYFICVNAVQNCYAGGIASSGSNYMMFVGPVNYSLS